jgi:tetratricopeptide (TPR) repeat protein
MSVRCRPGVRLAELALSALVFGSLWTPAWSQKSPAGTMPGPSPVTTPSLPPASPIPDAARTADAPDRLGAVIQNLLDNAKYWRAHGNPKAALTTLKRALSYAPNNAEALAAAGELAVELGDYDAAAKYRQALTRLAPADPRVATLAAEHPLTPAEAALLEDARRLGKAGQASEAVAAYQRLFNGTVPPSLALEYYDVLGATSTDGFAQAHDKLSKLAEQAPDDDHVQLAYAQLLIKQEKTRDEGIRMLVALSKKPDVSRDARQSWRDVLLWQGPSETARAQLDAYLQDNPHDPAIDAKLESFAEALPDRAAQALVRGYYEMATEPLKAQDDFKTALRLKPNNPEALAMMAALLRLQGRPAEAQLYLDKALALAPDQRDALVTSAGGDYPGTLPLNLQEQVEIVRLTSAGDYDTAEKLLTRLYQGREQASSYNQLGDIQLRAGRLDDAEQSFRQARTADPNNVDAACGLADVLGRKGKYDEANAALTEATGLYARAKNKAGLRRIAISRAGLLQDRAAKLAPDAAVALYQAGLAGEPRNIYIRVALARTLQATGQDGEAAAVMTKGVELAQGDKQSVQIATELATPFTAIRQLQAEIKAAQRTSLAQPLRPSLTRSAAQTPGGAQR